MIFNVIDCEIIAVKAEEYNSGWYCSCALWLWNLIRKRWICYYSLHIYTIWLLSSCLLSVSVEFVQILDPYSGRKWEVYLSWYENSRVNISCEIYMTFKQTIFLTKVRILHLLRTVCKFLLLCFIALPISVCKWSKSIYCIFPKSSNIKLKPR